MMDKSGLSVAVRVVGVSGAAGIYLSYFKGCKAYSDILDEFTSSTIVPPLNMVSGFWTLGGDQSSWLNPMLT